MNDFNHQESDRSSDQRSARLVQQAINDDQGLSAVDILVTAQDGAITLAGQVSTEQQMNLATNTAIAVGAVDKVHNHMELPARRSILDIVFIKDGSSLIDRLKKYKEIRRAQIAKESQKVKKDLAQDNARADDDGFAI